MFKNVTKSRQVLEEITQTNSSFGMSTSNRSTIDHVGSSSGSETKSSNEQKILYPSTANRNN
jgi:hypothetical protein